MRRALQRVKRLARASPLGVAAIVAQAGAAATAIVLLLIAQGQSVPLISAEPYEIQAAFTDAGGLKEGKQPVVTVAGVPLGRVSKVRYASGRAIATLELKPEAKGRIHKDATALITPRSALNDLSVDVDPGSAKAGVLPDDALIHQDKNITPVNLDRVAGVLDTDTRAHLMILADQLRVGLHGRAPALRAALRELGPFFDSSGRVAAALHDRDELLVQLVDDLEVVFTTLARRGGDLRDTIGAGAATFETVANRQQEVAETMRRLAPVVANLKLSMDEATRLATSLQPALEELRPFASNLRGGLGALRRFVPAGRGLARDLDDLGEVGPRSLSELEDLLAELRPTARSLSPSTRKLLPVTQALDKNKHGIGRFGSNFSGVFSGQDINGPTLRAYGFFEPVTPENFGLGSASATERKALRADVASALERVCIDTNPVACLARFLTPGLPSELTELGRLAERD